MRPEFMSLTQQRADSPGIYQRGRELVIKGFGPTYGTNGHAVLESNGTMRVYIEACGPDWEPVRVEDPLGTGLTMVICRLVFVNPRTIDRMVVNLAGPIKSTFQNYTNTPSRITGSDGDDFLLGGKGNDTISGGAGDDAIGGDAGNDSIVGGPGADVLFGGLGKDTVMKDAGDMLIGGQGEDTVREDV